MVENPILILAVTLILAIGTELLHRVRVRRLAVLAFGPRKRPAAWARIAPLLRILALGCLGWGLPTLMLIEPKVHHASGQEPIKDGDYKHVLLVLDVSPSMRLVDAGPDKEQSRMQRARRVMESFFKRIPLAEYRISVVAVYNGAKAVVIDTVDIEVVHNILGDLPMHYAFESGKTKLLEGLEEAFELAKPWKPGSTSVILVSDGDTVSSSGMPKKPDSIGQVLVVGVGDPRTGKFIDGRQSKQDVSTLRQIALRLGGRFHNGNERHLGSQLISDLTDSEGRNPLERLTRREYALIACGVGGCILALLPMFLHFWGTRWRPGRVGGPGLPATHTARQPRGRGPSKRGIMARSTLRPGPVLSPSTRKEALSERRT